MTTETGASSLFRYGPVAVAMLCQLYEEKPEKVSVQKLSDATGLPDSMLEDYLRRLSRAHLVTGHGRRYGLTDQGRTTIEPIYSQLISALESRK